MADTTLFTPPGGPAPGSPPARSGPIQREVAHRLFAAEFNQSRHEIKGQGEKEPSFLVSPLGAKVNRLHIVGVCTDVEPMGASGEVYRARISDPTGVFTVYAGQYQPEAAQALAQLQPPQFVAITGKARTYEPEPGSVFVSVRPESVAVVDEATRDHWIASTAERTLERLKAATAAQANPAATADEIAAQGVPRAAAEGAVLAREPYGLTDLGRLRESVVGALKGIMPGGEVKVHRDAPAAGMGSPGTGAAGGPAAVVAPATVWKAPAQAPASNPAEDALDAAVFEAVKRLQLQKGARWDDIVGQAPAGATAEQVEESLNRLMDKGLVYEPTLGILKTT